MALATSTIIAGIGLAVAAAGAATTAIGTQQQAKATEKAEDLRQQQMNLDAQRKRRNIIREMIIQQAVGRSNAAVQGVSGGDSAVIGGQQQAVTTAGQNTLAVNQGQAIGSGIFQANKDLAAGQVTSAWGNAAQNVGGQIVQNSTTISRVGASAGLWEDGY